jgi:hypothetical protein
LPGGGITQQGKWKNTKNQNKYLFPQKAMAKIFRANFVARLRANDIVIPQSIAKSLFAKSWIVYAKQPFGGPKFVMEYLGRYTHKIAISNHRIKSINNKQIQFTYKDYRTGGNTKISSLDSSEFLRRFCQHILPRGFVRMRHYGILASKNKAKELNIAKQYLGQELWQKVTIDWQTIASQKLNIDISLCPHCKKGQLELVKNINPERGPPILKLTPQTDFWN